MPRKPALAAHFTAICEPYGEKREPRDFVHILPAIIGQHDVPPSTSPDIAFNTTIVQDSTRRSRQKKYGEYTS